MGIELETDFKLKLTASLLIYADSLIPAAVIADPAEPLTGSKQKQTTLRGFGHHDSDNYDEYLPPVSKSQ